MTERARMLLLCATPLLAQCPLPAHSSSSANYTQSASTLSATGGDTSAGVYAQTATAGVAAGTATAGGDVLRTGFIAQLTDPAALSLSAEPDSVSEGGTRTLAAHWVNDDATRTVLPPSSVSWQAISGPVAFVAADGTVHTTSVYQATNARIAATAGGLQSTIDLLVLDTVPDNYRSYAGDGLGDAWQVGYFGENNPLAAPGADVTGTGQDNRFKYVAGLNPVDRLAPNARFTVQLELVPGQPNARRVIFRPRFADRSYTVLYSDDLATWQPVAAGPVSDAGDTRTVTDTTAAGNRRFYRVEVTYP